MKKISVCTIAAVLITALLSGCGASGNPQGSQPPATETTAPTTSTTLPTNPTTESVPESVPAVPADDIVFDAGEFSDYANLTYAEQIRRYYTALSEKWDTEQYFDKGMSALPVHYYEGNPLENVGFGFVDLDNDDNMELVIGAILNAEMDPAVFEIWTLVDGEPVMLVQGGSDNHIVLQYTEEDRMWYVVSESSNGAASNATYYMMLCEGKLDVMQGIMFNALADEENPWFMTYDLDWDASNDSPIDEDMAIGILDSNRRYYTALEYFPFA